MAGVSRIGAEAIPCSTCHMTSTLPNDPAPSPPRAGIPWQLAPVEFLWYGQSGTDICKQLKRSRPATAAAMSLVCSIIFGTMRHLVGSSREVGSLGKAAASRPEPSRTMSKTSQNGVPLGSLARNEPACGIPQALSQSLVSRRLLGLLDVMIECLQLPRGLQEQSVSSRRSLLVAERRQWRYRDLPM